MDELELKRKRDIAEMSLPGSTVCDVCAANVFRVNMDLHMQWHRRTGTE